MYSEKNLHLDNLEEGYNNIPSSFSSFLSYFIRQQWGKFLCLFITTSTWALNEGLFPYFVKQIIDIVASSSHPSKSTFSLLLGPLSLMLSIWSLMEVCKRIQSIVSIKTFPYFEANIRNRVFSYTLSHSFSFFSHAHSGGIANKALDLPRSCTRVMETVLYNLVPIIFTFLIMTFLMTQVSYYFTFLMILFLSSHLFVTFSFVEEIGEYNKKHAEDLSKLGGGIIDSLSNIISVSVFSNENYEKKRFEYYQEVEASAAEKAGWKVEKLNLVRSLITLGFFLALIYLLLKGWYEGKVTVGDFSLILMSSLNLMHHTVSLTVQMTRVFQEMGAIQAGLSLITIQHEIKDPPNAKPLVVSEGKIEIDHLTFSYKNSSYLFKDFNLSIRGGEKVGLVGFSGAGKSSLVNLILRLYEAQQGHIYIDGQDITQVTQKSLRENIAIITQDPSLFHRSFLENIRYGRLDASDEEVKEASRLAHCHEFINSLPQRYDTLVGERGVKLSGGQRQRISIARAILKDSPIIILDEASSSLDSLTEKLIQEGLEKLMHGKTTLVIAHRFSTLAHMDRIIVLDKGEIVEEGKLEDLLKKKGLFSKMWDLQMEGVLPKSSYSQ